MYYGYCLGLGGGIFVYWIFGWFGYCFLWWGSCGGIWVDVMEKLWLWGGVVWYVGEFFYGYDFDEIFVCEVDWG